MLNYVLFLILFSSCSQFHVCFVCLFIDLRQLLYYNYYNYYNYSQIIIFQEKRRTKDSESVQFQDFVVYHLEAENEVTDTSGKWAAPFCNFTSGITLYANSKYINDDAFKGVFLV